MVDNLDCKRHFDNRCNCMVYMIVHHRFDRTVRINKKLKKDHKFMIIRSPFIKISFLCAICFNNKIKGNFLV
ncbi:hypothetical protein BpHYR1_048301 [Brachionus plicatilis]|uniref:Uncharacterized protein n=1 Tax=Brachionus plicatilis TaxID=10195 RepID=A0A3M7Q8M9_BRAPC|nr:hypothetical protein BpHYR1_048301 [Brachionus plicatilis]